MAPEETPWTESSRALLDAARRSLGGHPPPEVLFAYSEGTLEEPQAEALQDHLALCPECADTILDLGAFPEVPVRRGGKGRDHVPTWEAMAARLSLEEPGIETRHPGQSRRRIRWLAPVAAGLVVGVLVALGIGRLLPGPPGVVNMPLVDLVPVEEAQREGAAAKVVKLPRGTELVGFLLNLWDPGEFSSYRLELETQGGRLVRAWDQVQLTEGETFNLVVPRTVLPPGRYVVRLSGVTEGQVSELAEYQVQIVEE